MALSNRSAKTLKAEPVELKQDPPFLPDNLRKEHEAARECLSLLRAELVASDGTPHPGTILSAAAWLTGTSLAWSLQCEERSRPGTMLPPADLNQEWENLVYLLEEYNLHRTDIPVGRVVLAAMGASRFFTPQVEMLTVQTRLQKQFKMVMEKHGFDPREGTRVGILLCSILIQQYSCAGIIDSDTATGVAAQRIFEAAVANPLTSETDK